MNYKKELRWLGFILGPFIAILSLHVLTPLQIKSSCFDIFTEVFGITSAGLHFRNSARSMHLQNSKIIRSLYEKLATQLNLFVSISTSQINPFGSVSYQNNSLVNAYMIEQNSSFALNTKIQKSQSSMWLDIDNKYHNLQELPLELQNYVKFFLSVQPYIKSYFNHNKQDLIDSVSVFYKSKTDSIYFQYPFSLNNPLDHINLTSLDMKFDTIVGAYPNRSNSQFFIPLLQFDVEDLTYMSLCVPAVTSEFQSIICINIEIDSFGTIIWQKLGLLNSQVFATNAFLSIDAIEIHSQTITIVFQFDKTGFRGIEVANSSFQIGNQNLNLLINQVEPLQFYTLFQDETDLYISQIKCISFPNNLQSPHFVTQIVRSVTASKYQSLSSKLNTIVVVTIILVVIQIIAITLILKILLDSVEKGLFQLGNLTHHIMRGDINIQIPSYDGTKDIGQVYEVSKKLNKLHRYSTQSYFSGHFSQKILKYVEALQFIKSLNYDPGNLYQNLGEAYLYIEQWDLSLKYLHKSVENIYQHIADKFEPFEMIFKKKLNKQPLPHRYRETELTLVRRLFKLVYTYIRYLQMGPIRLKQIEFDNPNDQSGKQKLQRLNSEFQESLVLIKKAFYPNFQKFSEVLITLSFQCKNKFGNKKIEEGKAVFKKLEELYALYRQNHPTVMKMLKQKGSKNKYLYSCNKMTFQSRYHPDLMVALMTSTKAKIIAVSEKQPSKFTKIFQLYASAFKTSLVTMNTAYMLALEVRKFLNDLKINPQPYETTQLFKQFIPYRTLYDGELTKENETFILRKAGTQCIGLQREYVFVLDCDREIINGENLQEFYEQRANHMFTKLIKGHDRVSIIKYNTKQGIKVECNLLMKKENQTLLTKSLTQAIAQRNKESRLKINLFQVVSRAIWRIKSLQKEKLLVFFFRSLKHYQMIIAKVNKKRTLSDKRKTQAIINAQINQQSPRNFFTFQQFGEYLIEILRTPGLRNTKLIFFCGKDNNQDFIKFFGLHDINRRIWADNHGLNKANNTVFVIQDKHRSDIDRILMPKVTDVPDNNIFIL